jgi:hypothetical protein
VIRDGVGERGPFLESVRAGVCQDLHVQCFFVFGFPEETLRIRPRYRAASRSAPPATG